MSRLTIAAFILVALIASACNVGTDAGSESEVQIPQGTATAPIATQNTVSGQTVTDTRVGFTFTYPDGWTLLAPGDVTDSVAYAYTMQSIPPTTGGGGGGLPEGETKIDLYINPSDANVSLANIESRIQQEDADSDIFTIATIEPTTLADGRQALTVRGSGMGGDFMSIYTIIKGYEVSGAVFGDEQRLLDVFNSIRETN
jgi:hypothetical protein